MVNSEIKILMACGGTGGHIFPAVAIAEAMKDIAGNLEIVFAGTSLGLEGDIIPKMGFKLVSIYSAPIKGGVRRLMAFMKLPLSFKSSYSLLKNEKPDLVVGIGGYAAGPLTLVASLMKIPTAILEPNAIAGLANRLLGRFVNRVYTGFFEAGEFFPRKKVLMSGNPVRGKIASLKIIKKESGGDITVFCFGGSQGAVALNRAVIESLKYLRKSVQRYKFIHQVGKNDDPEKIRRAYSNNGFEHSVYNFTDKIWESYEKADIVIARSGASTIAEISTVGLPAILVPYPFAADNHQEANAESVVRCGGAVLIDQKNLTGELLASEISKLTPSKLSVMRSALLGYSKPNAAKKIAEDCLQLVKD